MTMFQTVASLTPKIQQMTKQTIFTFANSLDPDQARQNAGSDLNPKRLTLRIIFMNYFFEYVYFGKKSDDKKAYKIAQHAVKPTSSSG